MNRIEKTWEELDFSLVDFDSGNWSWGRGGKPLGDWEFSISHVTDDLVKTRYALPPVLSEMLRGQLEYGKQEAQMAMRRAIGEGE